MQRAALTLGLIVVTAASAAAQAPKSIDPGMKQSQVVERLGPPTATRTSGTATYLFYKNGCLKECGIDDFVVLEGDSVVDAVFRSPERAYSGKSSSPRAIPREVAARAHGGDVTQSGAARPDAPAKAEPKPPEATKAPAPTPAKPATPATTPVKTPGPTAATQAKPTTARKDSVTGTLRIPVKPPVRGADSAKAATKRPPGEG